MNDTGSAPQPTESAVVTDGPVRAEETNWTVGQWNGMPNYECKECPFSTLDLPVMVEHREKHHESKKPDQAVKKHRYTRRE